MDALSDVLRTMRLKGGVFLYSEFREPWCVAVEVVPEVCAPYLSPSDDIIPYHYILEGQVMLGTEDGTEISLGPGDSVLFPRNDPHMLASDLSRPAVSGAAITQRSADGGLLTINYGGNGALARVVCGFLGGDGISRSPFFGSLPAHLLLDTRRMETADWVGSSFRFAAQRMAEGHLGSDVVLAKLSELLLVEALRAHAERLPEEQTGWLAALRDPYVSKAMALMHAEVAEAWTVEDLARRVGLSRSALAERFVTLLGMPPMHYLTQWRMQRAAQELLTTQKAIAQIAFETGYESEATFTRAFKRMMDAPPGAWRRQRR